MTLIRPTSYILDQKAETRYFLVAVDDRVLMSEKRWLFMYLRCNIGARNPT